MDVYKTHGAFSWSELTTPDPAKATEFYGTLFGWKIEAADMGGPAPYHVVKIGDESIGGLMAPPAPGIPPNWCPYVTVSDCDATVAKAQSLGGKVLAGPMDIPNVGRFAAVADPQGAVINVIAYSPPAQ